MARERTEHLEKRRTPESGPSDVVPAHTVTSVYAAMSTATAIAAGFHHGIGFDALAHLSRPEAIRP
ncbi:hypothetical protein ACIQVT_08535 [Streptomyces sp. NPDC100445]|uniref:hypothetical protein n=1 Tax=Streptomyces sp. NPDC100445 TaxID=3366102 RepID=UPI00382C5E28